MGKNSKGQETNDQHIHGSGRSRLLSIGKYVPSEWGWVRVTQTHKEGNKIWVSIEALELVEKSTQ